MSEFNLTLVGSLSIIVFCVPTWNLHLCPEFHILYRLRPVLHFIVSSDFLVLTTLETDGVILQNYINYSLSHEPP